MAASMLVIQFRSECFVQTSHVARCSNLGWAAGGNIPVTPNLSTLPEIPPFLEPSAREKIRCTGDLRGKCLTFFPSPEVFVRSSQPQSPHRAQFQRSRAQASQIMAATSRP